MSAVEPLRIEKSERGVWRGYILRGGELRWFSLRTKDESEARKKWADYCDMVHRAFPEASHERRN
jgi:hypothetical protein